MKLNFLLAFILSSFNLLLAQTTFEENFIIDDSYVIRPSNAHLGDIDGDGDLDIMTAGSRNVVWFENIDELGTYGKRKLIANYPIPYSVSSPFLADIDGDGDLDVMVSGGLNERIIWFENLDGNGNFGSSRGATNFQGTVFLSDIDSDGDLDLLTSYYYNGNKISWLKNLNGSGQFGSLAIIDVDIPNVKSLRTADLDGDGDKDVLLVSEYEDKIMWYENLDGNGSFGLQRIISTAINDPTIAFAADIDNDGDNDIISTSEMGNFIAWQENLDGTGNFGSLQIISGNIDGPNSINVADIDNDGDNDVFFASRDDNYLGFFENLNGQGSFAPARIISDKVSSPIGIKIGDIDNDGYLDVMDIAAKNAKISWYKNEDGLGNFGNQYVVLEDVDNVENICTADLDGDGDLDLISASHNTFISGNSLIAWFENLDGHGHMGKHKGIDYSASARIVRAADVDGDSDMDIIVGAYANSDIQILWYENLDGLGNFGPLNDISNGVLSAMTSIETADVDGDDDIDIVFTSYSDFGWIENSDGLGNFNIIHHLTNQGGYDSVTYPADIDGDGDIDLLSFQRGRTEAIWYENLDGTGNFSNPHIIYELIHGGIHILNAADMDMDGDMDVVIGTDQYEESLIWVENTGNGNFGNATIITEQASKPHEIALGDLDNDNDIDVAFTHYLRNKVVWIENIDGQGNFGAEMILTDTAYEANDVIITDLDGDLDMDIIASTHAGNSIIWYKNDFILSVFNNPKVVFSIYPNPTSAILNINTVSKIVEVEIFNTLGQWVRSENNPDGIQSVNIQHLNAGIYFLKVTDATSNSSTKKFIKQN